MSCPFIQVASAQTTHRLGREETLERLFGDEVRSGVIPSALDISDAWKNSNSANTNLKIWAAKFTARHPNLIPVEVSNFKCGHDAFVSNVIEQISHCAGKPHFCFRDMDENKPHGSLQIRIETMHYFLKQYTRSLVKSKGMALHNTPPNVSVHI